MASNDTLQTIAGVLGNVLEWYGKYILFAAHMICSYYDNRCMLTSIIYCSYAHIDFGIYGFFSDTISEVFFPPGGEHNLVYSYLVFGGGECDDRANELSRYNVLCVF